jgi:hypothetical protein
MAADLTSAEAYFEQENHIHAASWARYNEQQKKAALAQAARILARACSVADVTAEFDTDESINPEYAIFEQALFMLQNLPMANSDDTMAVPEAADPQDPAGARKPDARLLAPEAIAWLTFDKGISLARG